jgi:hypothetical protein
LLKNITHRLWLGHTEIIYEICNLEYEESLQGRSDENSSKRNGKLVVAEQSIQENGGGWPADDSHFSMEMGMLLITLEQDSSYIKNSDPQLKG